MSTQNTKLTSGESKTIPQSLGGFNDRPKLRGADFGTRTKSEEEVQGKDSSRRDISSKIKTVNITDIGIYEGNCAKGNIPHGTGKLKLKNGDFYEGEFENGCFRGEGRMYSADGCEYLGTWKDNCRHGKGKETWPNGNSFTGEFQNDKKHGYGNGNITSRSFSMGGQ